MSKLDARHTGPPVVRHFELPTRDAELNAIKIICEVMQDFSDLNTARRILGYVSSRLNSKIYE